MRQRALNMELLFQCEQKHSGRAADQRADHAILSDPDAAASILLHAEHSRDARIEYHALTLPQHVQQQT